jgi:hypothetical protein
MDPPGQTLDDYFRHDGPENYDVQVLLASYTDRQLNGRSVSVILNAGDGLPQTTKPDREEGGAAEDALEAAAEEPDWPAIHARTRALLGLLADAGMEMAIVDCPPGLALVSGTVRDLVDAHVYVTTPNRSDCAGLLKAADLRGLDEPNAILVINKAEPPLLPRLSLADALKRDPVTGPMGKGLLSQLAFLGASKKHTAFLPLAEELRSGFTVGSSGQVPTIRANSPELAFLRQVSAFLDDVE